ncbi:unnamed protein product [Effrenium voratum]|nr:unnamed protein product [Effrenium voratum]
MLCQCMGAVPKVAKSIQGCMPSVLHLKLKCVGLATRQEMVNAEMAVSELRAVASSLFGLEAAVLMHKGKALQGDLSLAAAGLAAADAVIFVLPALPHGWPEFLAQAARASPFEWEAALKERRLEATELRLVVELEEDGRDAYHYEALLEHGFVPRFLWAELLGRNTATVRAWRRNPSLVRRSGNWLIRPNPNYFDYEQGVRAPKDLKFGLRGFRLIAWWIHPELQTGSVFFAHGGSGPGDGPCAQRRLLYEEDCPEEDSTFDNECVVRLSEFATYLMTWRDLRPEHLPELRQLQADVMQHLEEIYGVQEHELADYDLQFHTTTAMRSPLFGAERGQYMTLHLQIGVRHCWTLSCMSRHMALGEVIKMLEQGGDARPAHVYCEENSPYPMAPIMYSEKLSLSDLGLGDELPAAYHALDEVKTAEVHREAVLRLCDMSAGTGSTAVVLLGPPGVGKSTLRQMLTQNDAIPGLGDFPLRGGSGLDAVVVDGDLVRQVQPLSPQGTAWIKDQVIAAAIREKKNLLVATVRGEDIITRLVSQGYKVHLMLVFTSSSLASTRRSARADRPAGRRDCRAQAFAEVTRSCFAASLAAKPGGGTIYFVENCSSPRVVSSCALTSQLEIAQSCYSMCHSAGVPVSWSDPCWLDRAELHQRHRVGCLGRNKRLVLVAGPQGAGKTSAWRDARVRRALFGLEDFAVIDGEVFYEAHWGHQVVMATQQRCRSHLDLAADMKRWKVETLKRCCDQGLDIVLPVTGTSPGLDMISYFKDAAGYTVSAVLLFISPKTSMHRAERRHVGTGRPCMDHSTYRTTCQFMSSVPELVNGKIRYIDNEDFLWKEVSRELFHNKLCGFLEGCDI